MNALNRRKLFIYSSLFIALAMNIPKLLALRKGGVMAQLWHFDLAELIFQFSMTFLYCMTAFYYNRNNGRVFLEKWQTARQGHHILVNIVILIGYAIIGGAVLHLFFQPVSWLLGGYGLRFAFCLLLVAIELRVCFLMEDARDKEMENEHLRNAYLQSELSLLKGQLNPHFFFNALSSLSAVVREDPRKAQQYISHLSKVFRYSLESSKTNLVTLKEELDAVRSYAQLLTMRYEEGFVLSLPDKEPPSAMIPPMSLQLLVENAVKHNTATIRAPLEIVITIDAHELGVSNNLQPVRFPEPGTGIGLANLNERYRILMQKEIAITQTAQDFIVKLPLS